MEGAKESRSKFGFSWADEVEREEEQEKQINDQIPVQEGKEVEKPADKKVDPFGAARPREVVLEEKGVDWKKLDQEFDFDSSVRECKSKTKKSVTKKKPLVIQNSQKTVPCQKNVPCEEFVPPLKYAPKNIDSVFEEIHRAHKLKPNNSENSKASDQCNENTVLMGCRDAKPVSTNSVKGSAPYAYAGAQHQPHNAQWVPKGSANRKMLPNLNSVLVKNNKKGYVEKEKTGSNFEPESVTDNEPAGQRRVLVELNNSTNKKAPCSNSYFGVLDLLEPSSCEKSSSKKWVGEGGNTSARKRSAVAGNEELGAGKKKNQERPIINRRKKEKISKR